MQIRIFNWDDLPEILRITNEFWASLAYKSVLTMEVLEENWREPQNHPDENCFVGILPEKGMVGYMIVDVLDVPNQANGVYCVPPEYTEVGQALIRQGEAHFKALAEKASPNSDEIFMLYNLPTAAKFVFELLAKEAYQHVR